MKLIIDATVAGPNRVIADGLVRAHVLTGDGGSAGRLSVTVELWEWIKLWAAAANEQGWDIEIVERQWEAGRQTAPETMRGRLVEAVEERAEREREREREWEGQERPMGIDAKAPGMPQDRLGGIPVRESGRKSQGDGKAADCGGSGGGDGKISPLWRKIKRRRS